MAIISRLLRLGNHGLGPRLMVIKRWSGHNAMDIAPSMNFGYRFIHNWMHFYFIIAAVPLAIITTIINIRANPELAEAPDGYEPRYWEYYKNPITRNIARYLFNPLELDREISLAHKDFSSEDVIRKRVVKKCDKVMAFYNDHRSIHFIPYNASYYRQARDFAEHRWNFEKSELGEHFELAYSQTARPVVPVEGYTNTATPKE